MKRRVETTKQRRVTLKFDGNDLRRALRKYGIPRHAEMFVIVPGGADWSLSKLDFDSDLDLIVEWSTEETEEEAPNEQDQED